MAENGIDFLGQAQGVKAVGIDLGYGYTKIVTDARESIFPTAVSPAFATHFVIEETIRVKDSAYFVGEAPLRERVNLIDVRNRDFVMSDPWFALLARAIEISGVKTGNMVLGIPPGYYTRSLAEEIARKVKEFEYEITNNLGSRATRVNYDRVKVVPQGAGTFFLITVGLEVPSRPLNILIVDVGHQTVDIVFFDQNRYVESTAASYPVGVSVLLERLVKVVSQNHGINITIHDAERILKDGGTVRLLNNVYDVSSELKAEANAYAESLLSVVDRHIENLGARVSTVLACGGGAELLKAHTGNRRNYSFYVPMNPQFSNARGYWKYAKIL